MRKKCDFGCCRASHKDTADFKHRIRMFLWHTRQILATVNAHIDYNNAQLTLLNPDWEKKHVR